MKVKLNILVNTFTHNLEVINLRHESHYMSKYPHIQ